MWQRTDIALGKLRTDRISPYFFALVLLPFTKARCNILLLRSPLSVNGIPWRFNQSISQIHATPLNIFCTPSRTNTDTRQAYQIAQFLQANKRVASSILRLHIKRFYLSSVQACRWIADVFAHKGVQNICSGVVRIHGVPLSLKVYLFTCVTWRVTHNGTLTALWYMLRFISPWGQPLVAVWIDVSVWSSIDVHVPIGWSLMVI